MSGDFEQDLVGSAIPVFGILFQAFIGNFHGLNLYTGPEIVSSVRQRPQ